MSDTTPQDQAYKKLGSLIKNMPVAMLTTADPDGTLRSRPMATHKSEFNGTLWFFTHAHSPKVDEIERAHQVNLSYADAQTHQYVSISGTATLVRDAAKNAELWNPVYKIWFPGGLDDPELALLRVDVEKAEYWATPSSPVVQLIGFVKSMVTGEPSHVGEHEKVEMR
jgi:general stress protein 26